MANSTKHVTYTALAGPKQRIADGRVLTGPPTSLPTSLVGREKSEVNCRPLLDHLEEFNLKDERLVWTNDATGTIRPVCNI